MYRLNDHHQVHDEVVQFHDHDFQPTNWQINIQSHFQVFFQNSSFILCLQTWLALGKRNGKVPLKFDFDRVVLDDDVIVVLIVPVRREEDMSFSILQWMSNSHSRLPSIFLFLTRNKTRQLKRAKRKKTDRSRGFFFSIRYEKKTHTHRRMKKKVNLRVCFKKKRDCA